MSRDPPNKKARNASHSNYDNYEQVRRATLTRLTREALLAPGRPGSSSDNSHSAHFDMKEDGKEARKPKDKRITDLLNEHLATQFISKTEQGEQKMEGDVVSLGLHSSFFVEGVKIGWPYPVVMTPQRQVSFMFTVKIQ